MSEGVEKVTLVVAVEELRRATDILYKGFVDMFGAIPSDETTVAEESKTPLDQSIRAIMNTNSDLHRFNMALQTEVYHRIAPEQPPSKKP